MSFPFPASFPKLLTSSPALDTALASAMTEARARFPALRTAIAIAAIDESGSPATFGFSGNGHTDTHFSASLLKVAAMYAAFQLRNSADVAARSSDAITPAEVFAHLSTTMITKAVPLIPAAQRKPPDYRSIFTTISLLDGGFGIDFNGDFETQMRNMIVPGDNLAAARCVMWQTIWVNTRLFFADGTPTELALRT